MKSGNVFARNRFVVAVAIPIVVILFPIGYSAVSALSSGNSPASQPFLERPAPEHKECVRDIEWMRYHHWELLHAIRKEVVRYGKRGELGLNKCRECHASRERFCDKCHNSVNVGPDCYGCHYYP